MSIPANSRALLARLAPHDAPALAPLLGADARKELRNAVIRTALRRFYPDMPPSNAAKALASDLAIGPDFGTAKGDMIAVVLNLDDGRALGWSQILRILE
jgi:hypothetical protein